ncbi:hypothetical protein KJZ67_05125 [Patescibacteria group bacterium]|nr:hypothetical protein [Patescibacteria group bacterium]
MKNGAFLHTIVLFTILFGGTFTFWFARGNTALQLAIGVVTTIAYVAWGIIHHSLKGDLHRKVVIEYVLVGLIAIVLLTTLAL